MTYSDLDMQSKVELSLRFEGFVLTDQTQIIEIASSCFFPLLKTSLAVPHRLEQHFPKITVNVVVVTVVFWVYSMSSE